MHMLILLAYYSNNLHACALIQSLIVPFYRSILSAHTETEQLRIITFCRSTFRNESDPIDAFPYERNPERNPERSTFWNEITRNGKQSFPGERGLRNDAHR